MGACCGGMKPGQHHKSLPENKKPNNVDEKEKLSNGPQAADDAVVAKETAETGDEKQQHPDHETSNNHTNDHAQSTPAAPEEVELKITEPDRTEASTAPEPVCPVAEKPDVCPEVHSAPPPVPTEDKDTKTKGELEKPPAEVLFVSEEGDIMQPASSEDADTRVVQTTTTVVTEHSSKTEVTEVRTTTVVEEPPQAPAEPAPVIVDQSQSHEEQHELGKVEDSQPTEPTKAADDVVLSADTESSTSAVVEQASESSTAEVVTDEAPVATTSAIDDSQIQSDSFEVTETPVGEVIVAASTVEEQQSVPPPPSASEQDQIPDASQQGLETADVTPAAAEQIHEQQPAAPEPVDEAVDEPTAVPCSEPSAEVAAEHEETSSKDLSVEPTTDALEVKPEETAAPTDSAEAASPAAETPAAVEALEEVPPAAAEEPREDSSAVTAETSEQSQTSAEGPTQPTDTEMTELPPPDVVSDVPTSDELVPADVSQPADGDTESKPEDGINLSAAHEETLEIQPEELPPPPPPEGDEVLTVGSEEHQELPEIESCVKPASDTAEQPEHHAINGDIEGQSVPSSTEATDHGGEVPVANEA